MGYRHIDTAYFYQNEAEIGKAIKDKIAEGVVKREDIFLVTKVSLNSLFFLNLRTSKKHNTILPSYGISIMNLNVWREPVVNNCNYWV